jgi:membrane protein DedA with SNARE-associated domain
MIGDSLQLAIALYPLLVIIGALLFLVIEGGEISFFFSLYIAHELHIHIVPVIVGAACLMVLGDVLYFLLGPMFRRWKWFQWFEEKMHPAIQTTVTYPFFVLPVVRFAYGLWHPLIVQLRAGGMPLKTLVQSSVVTTLIWVLALTAIYILALSAGRHYFRHIEVIVSGVIVGVMLISLGFRFFLHRHWRKVDTADTLD